jgi:intein/homing endonuclease
MADGSTRPIKDLRVGDEIIGTQQVGIYRKLVKTVVKAHWQTQKPAIRVRLVGGAEVICSGDHRWLTNRGWKYTTGTMSGSEQRPYLTTKNF